MTEYTPRYGELATPEQQRIAAGLPPVSEMLAPEPEEQIADAVAVPAPRRSADRIATIALLAYGLFDVVTTGISYLDLPAVLTETMKILGIDGEFTQYAQGRLWGMIAAIVLAVGWVVTAVLSVRRLRRGRIAWWFPVVGAVGTVGLALICVVVPVLSDPAFIEYFANAGS
ncbi:MAG: DUF6264 family protein [Microbacterium sp.]